MKKLVVMGLAMAMTVSMVNGVCAQPVQAADGEGRHESRLAGYAPRGEGDARRAFPHHLRALPREGVRRPERADPRRARAALLHGRGQGRSRRKDEHAAAVRRGGDGVQRRARQEPPGEQFPFGKPHLGGARGKGDGCGRVRQRCAAPAGRPFCIFRL